MTDDEIEQIKVDLWNWATKYSLLMGSKIHEEFTSILDRIDNLKENKK